MSNLCAFCGSKIIDKYPEKRKYCSVDCSRKDVAKKKESLKIERECPICKSKFVAKKPSGGLRISMQRFCSKKCSRLAMGRRFQGEYI